MGILEQVARDLMRAGVHAMDNNTQPDDIDDTCAAIRRWLDASLKRLLLWPYVSCKRLGLWLWAQVGSGPVNPPRTVPSPPPPPRECRRCGGTGTEPDA